jgi:hypothetical protein
MKATAQDIRSLKAKIRHLEQDMFNAIGNLSEMQELKAEWEASKAKLEEWT